MPEPEPKLAFWGERFMAWLIDVIIMGVSVGLLGLFTSFVTWQPFPFLPGWFPFVNFGFGGFVYFLYWTIMEGIFGQSVGKMVMHLRVARLDGGHVGMAEAIVESIGKAFFLFLDILIGWAVYPKKRQRVLNYLSGTIVVRE